MLKNIIKTIGLTEKEAKIYLATLKLGNSVVSEIANEAKINRVTAYTIIEKLLKKGLLSQSKKGKTLYFEAIDPEILYETQKEKLESLKRSLPDLKKIHKKADHPLIRYFEGIEGIKAIYADTLTAQTQILSFANSADIRTHWPEYDNEYVKKRVEKKIFLRGIALDDETGRHVKSEDKKYFRQIKLTRKQNHPFSNEINIYDNKIAYTSFGENPIGTIIENAELANTQRSIFEMLWESGELY